MATENDDQNADDQHHSDSTQDLATKQEASATTSKAGDVLGGVSKIASPFDLLYGENAPTFDDPTVQDWVSKQKDGKGFEKGLAGLRKLASQKGFEPPPEDADGETKEAFRNTMRKLNRIPDNIEDYKVNFGEDSGLDEPTQEALKKFGFENDVPASLVEKFIPFNQQFAMQIAEQHKEAELEKASELFGGPDEFGKMAEDLHKFLDSKGYNYEDQTFRNATAWKMLADMKAMQEELNELTGEGNPVTTDHGGGHSGKTKETMEARITELLHGDTADAKAFKNTGAGTRHLELRKEYVQLNKDLVALVKKQR